MSALRSALVQAAHLIADALELSQPESAPDPPPSTPGPKRKQTRKPYRPTTPPSDLDVARAVRAARKAGINLP